MWMGFGARRHILKKNYLHSSMQLVAIKRSVGINLTFSHSFTATYNKLDKDV